MISKDDFEKILQSAGVRFILSANTVVVESTKTIVFTFENGILISYVCGYTLRRLFDVKKVECDGSKISITDGGMKYEIAM